MVHIVCQPTADILERPSQYRRRRSVTESDLPFAIQAVDALAGRVQDQLMLRLQPGQFVIFGHCLETSVF
jgi:hypothetical protein